MEIYQLRVFVAVADAGGFASAADALEVAPSSVTRAVAKLEDALGVRLFQRTTRSVTLTEDGIRFLDRIVPVLNEIEAAVDHIGESKAQVSGKLRVAASVSFGQKVLAPALPVFTKEYPDIRVELVLSDSVSDIVAERIDVAIRHGLLPDSSLIARRLSEVRYRLVAAPSYTKIAKKIRSPSDLSEHNCVTFPYSAFQSQWRFSKKQQLISVDIDPLVTISNAMALLTCIKAGMGLGLLADWLINEDLKTGRLVEVLPSWIATGANFEPGASLWVVTPSRQFIPSKTKAFVDFLDGIV